MKEWLDQAEQEIEQFFTLNPDISFSRRNLRSKLIEDFTNLSSNLDQRQKIEFLNDSFNDKIEGIVSKFLESPMKRAEREAIEQFLFIVDKSAERLLESKPEKIEEETTLALLPHSNFNAQQWSTIYQKAEFPEAILNSVDAAERRKRTTTPFLTDVFDFCMQLDSKWCCQLLKQVIENNRPLDVDLILGLTECWRSQHHMLPDYLLSELISWATEERLERVSETVAKSIRKALSQQALLSWTKSRENSSNVLQTLKKLAPYNDKEKLAAFADKQLELYAKYSFQFSAYEKRLRKDKSQTISRAAVCDLQQMEKRFEPFIYVSHYLLDEIGGPEKMAMALLGFPKTNQKIWQQKLHELSVKTIRRVFLRNLRQNIKPTETIRQLTFGDDFQFQRLCGELDLGTKEFESTAQREKVIDVLAANYSSLREEKLLSEEISRQYRRIMRMLHTDSLARILPDELLKDEELDYILNDYVTLISAARKYLTYHRNSQLPIEEVWPQREEFVLHCEKLLLKLVKRSLL